MRYIKQDILKANISSFSWKRQKQSNISSLCGYRNSHFFVANGKFQLKKNKFEGLLIVLKLLWLFTG